MAGGFGIFAVGGALPIDWIGKAILDAIAFLLLVRLGRDLRREEDPMIGIPAVLTSYIEGLKAHDVDRIAATVSDDLAFVTPSRTLDKEQFLTMLRALYAGFPDWTYDHDEPENRGDAIAVRWRQGGTHTGTFAWPGLEPVPATGRAVKIPEHFFFYRVEGGLLVEIRPEPVPGGAPRGILEQIGVDRPPL
jgi:predicted ester cyclase